MSTLTALFFAWPRGVRWWQAFHAAWRAWALWQAQAGSQVFQRQVDPLTGRVFAPCRGVGVH